MTLFDTSNPTFIHGPKNAEDVVRLPGTPWIVACHFDVDISSGMPPTRFGPGHLEAIRIDTHEVRRLYPTPDSAVDWDHKTYPDCPAPPQPLSSHGLNVRPLGKDLFRLYVNNHGGRESVEILDVTVDHERLHVKWRGGVIAPLAELGVWPNGVAPLPDDGFVLSGFNVAAWRPGCGWEKLKGYEGTKPGAPLVFGPETGGMSNGVEVSKDGQWVFIADTLRHAVIRVPIVGGEQAVMKLTFGPNNLRWGEDGLLYAAGSIWPKIEGPGAMEKFFAQSQAITGIVAVSIDPKSLRVTEAVNDPAGLDGTYGATSTALQVDDKLWLSSEISDRIAILPRLS